MDIDERARTHAALGDPWRLKMVEELRLSDRTFHELAATVGLPGNAAAHHLGVLEQAGLIERRVSEGDRRRRYVSLHHERLDELFAPLAVAPGQILFVCTHNSARSQFAAALWHELTGNLADSAGSEPSSRAHPVAVTAAAEFGVDLSGARPKGYDAVSRTPDLVVSVCDRAREAGWPFDAPSIHWSVPDPVRAGTAGAFRTAFADLAVRVGRLSAAVPHAPSASTVRPISPEGNPMTTRTWNPPADMTPGEIISIRQSAAALERRWQGQLNVETIERFLAESLAIVLPDARIRTWVPTIVEKLTNDRLRALVRLQSDRSDLNPSVLFLCVHNAGRSQMAAGWMRRLAGDRVDVFSGGSEPAAALNQAAVAAMAEKGIDISGELPQPWADEIVRAADVIVTMGCGDACPVFPGKRYVDWELDDPAGKPIEEVRPIRDEIERRVRALMGELGVEPRPD